VLPSPDGYGYRSRVQFKLHSAGDRLKIGFFRQGTHIVEDATQGCPIAMPVINQVLERLRTVLPLFPGMTSISQINIDCGDQGAIGIVNYLGSDSAGAVKFFQENRSVLKPLSGLYLQLGKNALLQKVYGDDTLEYSLPDVSPDTPACRLTYRPGGFSQVNRAQNSALLQLVRRFADCRGEERILDLFCGNGNFSLPLAGCCAAVTGIEEYGDSIAAAIDNALLNGILNAEFIRADAAAGLGRLVADGRKFDCVLLDPPRSGAAELVKDICRLKPGRVIYVSCDPGTLGRDCGLFSAGGYQVQASVPVDMFPQTYHIESVTLLQRVTEGL
jgi:23S rRNA (uracil1939-C5)-methyltransferase